MQAEVYANTSAIQNFDHFRPTIYEINIECDFDKENNDLGNYTTELEIRQVRVSGRCEMYARLRPVPGSPKN